MNRFCARTLALIIAVVAMQSGPASAERIETIEVFDGIRRTDVPRYDVHLVSIPALKVVTSLRSEVNVTANLSQVAGSTLFRADDEHGHEAVYRLEPSGHLIEEKDEAAANYGKEVRLNFSDDTVNIQRPGAESTNLPLRDAGSNANPFQYAIANRDRSAVIWRPYTPGENLWVVRNLEAPVLERVESVDLVWDVAPDPASPLAFVKWEARTGDFRLSRLDISAAKLATLSGAAVRQGSNVTFVPGSSKLLAQDDSIIAIDPSNGKSSTIAVPWDDDSRPSVTVVAGMPYVLISEKLVDLANGKVVAAVPGFVPISAHAVVGNNLYYSAPLNDEEGALRFTKLVRLDLSKRRIAGQQVLPHIEPPPQHRQFYDSYGIQEIFPLTGNRLLLLTGTFTGFMDHEHRWQER